jgi:hypothetical protein
MTTDVTCRGCGIRVGREARSCWICKCPYPACHLPETDASEPEVVAEAVPAEPVRRAIPWVWALPAGFGLLYLCLAVVGACFLAAKWDRVQSQSMPTIKMFFARPAGRLP